MLPSLKHITQKLCFRKQFASEAEYQGVLKIAAQDGAVIGRRAVKTIIAFELIMIVYTLAQNLWTLQKALYFGGYVFLLLASIGALAAVEYVAADLRTRYPVVKSIGIWYDTALIAWAIFMTMADNAVNPSLSLLILITVLVIIPVVTFLPPVQYLCIHAAGCAAGFFAICALTEYGKFGNLVNFSVFSIISLISGLSFYGIRVNSYKRQVQLEESANRDALSLLYNRQMLGRVSAELWDECAAGAKPLTCILCDIDDFKQINDNCGHLMGDHWIRETAAVLQAAADTVGGWCFRYGGEEFMLVLPGCGAAQAVLLAETTQKALRAVCEKDESEISVTLSFGVYTAWPSGAECRMEKYFFEADRLMYDAKRAGKNRYCAQAEAPCTAGAAEAAPEPPMQ